MASLARSLLALAIVALLQVTCAQRVKVLGPIGSGRPGGSGEPIGSSQPGELGGLIGRSCPSNLFGRRSLSIQYDLEPIHLHNIVNDVVLVDPHEQDFESILVGEEISVCPERGVHVEVILTDSNSFDYVRVTSNETTSPTIKTMYVTRYRQRLLTPSSEGC